MRRLSKYLRATHTYFKDPAWMADKLDKTVPSGASDCLLSVSGGPVWANSKTQVIGTDNVLGYRTVILKTSEGTRNWLAPELGCALVRSEQIFFNEKDGKVRTINEHMAQKITIGEPDITLFAAVGDEITPREAYNRKMEYLEMGTEERSQRLSKNAAQLLQNDQDYVQAQRKQ